MASEPKRISFHYSLFSRAFLSPCTTVRSLPALLCAGVITVDELHQFLADFKEKQLASVDTETEAEDKKTDEAKDNLPQGKVHKSVSCMVSGAIYPPIWSCLEI